MTFAAVLRDIFLGFGIAAIWLAALAFARLTWALDRLHVVTFALLGAGLPLVLAAWCEDGLSQRTVKLTLVWLVYVVAGASMNQAIGRAIFARDEAAERL